MKTLITAGALALAAALCLAAPVTAAKKAGTYKLDIKGEQLTTWSYDKVMEPSCDFPESESGRQYIDFRTYDDTKVKVKKAKGGSVKLDFGPKDVTVHAEADVYRTYSTLYSQITPCSPGQGPYGGGDPPKDAIGEVRCDALGSLDFWTGNEIGEVESPYYPTDLENDAGGKKALFFAADPWWLDSTSSDRNLPSACEARGASGASIGIVESQGEWAGAIIPIFGNVPAMKLLGSKKKRVSFELGRTVNYPNDTQTYAGPPSTKGKTRADATLTFTRVKGR